MNLKIYWETQQWWLLIKFFIFLSISSSRRHLKSFECVSVSFSFQRHISHFFFLFTNHLTIIISIFSSFCIILFFFLRNNVDDINYCLHYIFSRTSLHFFSWLSYNFHIFLFPNLYMHFLCSLLQNFARTFIMGQRFSRITS